MVAGAARAVGKRWRALLRRPVIRCRLLPVALFSLARTRAARCSSLFRVGARLAKAPLTRRGLTARPRGRFPNRRTLGRVFPWVRSARARLTHSHSALTVRSRSHATPPTLLPSSSTSRSRHRCCVGRVTNAHQSRNAPTMSALIDRRRPLPNAGPKSGLRRMGVWIKKAAVTTPHWLGIALLGE